MKEEEKTCGDYNDFSTRSDWCNTHSKGVRSWFEACDDIDPIKRPEHIEDDDYENNNNNNNNNIGGKI